MLTIRGNSISHLKRLTTTEAKESSELSNFSNSSFLKKHCTVGGEEGLKACLVVDPQWLGEHERAFQRCCRCCNHLHKVPSL